MEVIKVKDENILPILIKTFSSGGLVIYPTETAYGVGVDATNSDAVSKLLEYKKRPEGRAISIAVANKKTAQNYVEINNSAENFYNNFLPGPITIISKSKGQVDKRLESEKGTLGIRIPDYKLILDFLNEFQKPITATSANYSGAKAPYSVEDILEALPEKSKKLIDLIIDAGTLPKNPPSTVIDTTSNELTIFRSGRIDPLKTQLQETVSTNSEDETIAKGYSFLKQNYVRDYPNLILLNGELGAGKTHFTKGLASALGMTQIIKSPTYNYVNEYKFGSNKFFHMDAWKIENKEDLNALGFYEWFKPGNVIVIEWPSVIINLDQDFFNKLNYFYINFTNTNYNLREIKIYKIIN